MTPGNDVELRENRLEVLEAVLDTQVTVNQNLREQLTWNSMLAHEDEGWSQVLGGGIGDYASGPTLDDLKGWAEKLRGSLGNVHMQRGLRLRTNNIWSGNIHYNEKALPGGSGAKVQTKKRVDDPLNQRNFFGAQAHNERESACYTDSVYLVIGDPSDHSLEPISILDVGAVALNPRRPDEIIAYRVDFMDYTQANAVAVKQWHYTDLAYGRRNKPGFGIKAQQGETAPDDQLIFDLHVNTQIGWAFGVPDSLTAYAWAKVYRDFVMNGKVMSDAMAQFAFQIATGSKKETDTAAARVAEPSDAGSTMIGANTLVPLTTAGKGYDFASGRSLLSIVASALEVSVDSLDADSSGTTASGSSSLDLATRLAMESRRQLHIDFDRRILLWMGADPVTLAVTFTSLDDAADVYRELQSLVLALDSGLYQPAPIEKRISVLLEIVGNTVPPGWLQPNNLKTVKAEAEAKAKSASGSSNDADGKQQGSDKDGEKASSTASPGQGRSKASGKGDNTDVDTRNDKTT
jgi:hypothetical protein